MELVSIDPTFVSWRATARRLVMQHTPPHAITWHATTERQANLFSANVSANAVSVNIVTAPGASGHTGSARGESVNSASGNAALKVNGRRAARVPAAFVALAESVSCHAEWSRWDALYRLLFRLTHGEPSLLEVATDPDVYRVMTMDKAVRRAVHKMHAFVRFRAVQSSGEASPVYVAWFEPVHHVVERAVPLFVRRFASMQWSILTPHACAHWDGNDLQITGGVTRDAAPNDDVLEELWRTYYAHIFNPARLSVTAMQAEMPKQYWANLPEASLIASLTRDAPARVARMLAQSQRVPEALPSNLSSTASGSCDVPEL